MKNDRNNRKTIDLCNKLKNKLSDVIRPFLFLMSKCSIFFFICLIFFYHHQKIETISHKLIVLNNHFISCYQTGPLYPKLNF